MQQKLQDGQDGQCDEEIPVSTIFRFMFLITASILAARFIICGLEKFTGYSVPFTNKTLPNPRIKSGSDLRKA